MLVKCHSNMLYSGYHYRITLEAAARCSQAQSSGMMLPGGRILIMAQDIFTILKVRRDHLVIDPFGGSPYPHARICYSRYRSIIVTLREVPTCAYG